MEYSSDHESNNLKEPQQMDAERSDKAEDVTENGHKINCKATCLGENVMNRRLEEGRVSDNFVYCLDNSDARRQAKRRRLDQGSIVNERRDREEEEGDTVTGMKRRRL
ncbi:unnamed protein product [Protopolystoma xenopodis]|uniref:Uncharacterized protein n=1 Tax=Protopolystoma xenopodis TaxID=117903 RepID=A0A3S5CN21_9PLAT|nr:unnamed protein product [Protopolystoma xenopodis]